MILFFRFSFILTFYVLFFYSCKEDHISEIHQRSFAVYSPDSPNSTGSAVLVSSRGHFLTAYHVVENLQSLRLSRDGSLFFNGRVIHKAFGLDLALIEVDQFKDSFSPLIFRDRTTLHAGEKIMSVGSSYTLIQSYYEGYIVHNHRSHLDSMHPSTNYIQTYGITFPGMSGSAVYDRQGRLLGIQKAMYSAGSDVPIGLVIPAGFIEEYLKHNGL
jgi:S1-C subfamily serine protease